MIPTLCTGYFQVSVPMSEQLLQRLSALILRADSGPKTFDTVWLPTELFRPVSDPGHDIGSIRADIATDAGLGDVRVVLPGSHDTASAVAAVPALEPPSSRPDWCYISLGTWALVGAELDRPLITPECLARNFTNEGGVGGTTRILKNLCGLWLVQQCRASWQDLEPTGIGIN